MIVLVTDGSIGSSNDDDEEEDEVNDDEEIRGNGLDVGNTVEEEEDGNKFFTVGSIKVCKGTTIVFTFTVGIVVVLEGGGEGDGWMVEWG